MATTAGAANRRRGRVGEEERIRGQIRNATSEIGEKGKRTARPGRMRDVFLGRGSIDRSRLKRGHHSVGRLHPGQPGDLVKIPVKAGDDRNTQLLAAKSDQGVMEIELA